MAGLTDYIFPRRCPVCHGLTGKPGALICEGCRDKFSYITEPTCMVCGKSMDSPERELCSNCETVARPFTRNISLYDYDDLARGSMAKFKFGGRREYADYYVSDFMGRKGKLVRSLQGDVIIPVPVHKDKKYARGYNQAAELGKRFAKALGIPMREDLLIRSRATTAQKELDPVSRRENLVSAFMCPYDLSEFKRVLLVDDIYTTGATLSACSRALRAAGAGKIYGLTICSTTDK